LDVEQKALDETQSVSSRLRLLGMNEQS